MSLSQFQRRRRFVLGGAILLAFALLLTVGSAWGEEAHEAIEAGGFALMAVGILGRMWCTLYIGGRKSAEIVREGPYSVMRNPLYVFSSVAMAGVGAQTGSLAVAVLFFAGCLVAFAIVVRREESYLREAFGAPYADYTRSVPRFLPDPRLFRDRATLSVPASRLYRTLGDGLVFLAAIPAFETVELLQGMGWVPVALRLF